MNPSCMILVKNEAYWLPYTLVQTEGIFDSYVIYDIGSNDGTQHVIKWWLDRMEGKVDIFVRFLPHCSPEVQGAFRNSMVMEGDQDIYFILDGDELYSENDLRMIPGAANRLLEENRGSAGRIKYGVVRRTEVTADLAQQYAEKRTHHRLYTKSAWWVGTHPGERPAYEINAKNEVHFPTLNCWHMHNTVRSPHNAEVPKREKRRGQRTYHPGNELTLLGTKLLDELPILREPIGPFEPNPALKKLQDEYRAR